MKNIGENTIEQLENEYWAPLSNDEGSYLISTCHELRSKKISAYTIEDLRIMIGQGIGMKYLVPCAIKELTKNILAEGHFYEGDLLKFVLTSDPSYWKTEQSQWKAVCSIFESNIKILEQVDTTESIRKGWFDSYKEFKQIHGHKTDF